MTGWSPVWLPNSIIFSKFIVVQPSLQSSFRVHPLLQKGLSSPFADYYFITSLFGVSDNELRILRMNIFYTCFCFCPGQESLFPEIFCRILFSLIFLPSLHLKGLQFSTDDRFAFDIYSMCSLAFDYVFWVQYFGPFAKQSSNQ